MGLRITLRRGDEKHIDKILRRFRKKCDKEGITKDAKKNMYYEKPSEKKRREKKRILKRVLKEQEEAKQNEQR